MPKNKYIDHLWTIPSQITTFDERQNATSIINIIENITIPPGAVPIEEKNTILPIQMHMTTLWRRGLKHKKNITIREYIISPDKERQKISEYKIPPGNTNSVHRCFTTQGGIRFGGFGKYRIVSYEVINKKENELGHGEFVIVDPVLQLKTQ